MSSLNTIINGLKVVKNMGWRYVAFRTVHELKRRTGKLKKRFPADPAFQRYLSLEDWKQQSALFFFPCREALLLPKNPTPDIAQRFETLKKGLLPFFNGIVMPVDGWFKNPDSGFVYDATVHWTEINDYSAEAGDIKFVWEKARFAYLYDIIRYDHHFDEDHAHWVFEDILSWIRSNKVNTGPHYKCSQEISLRVLNWTFALYFYRNSAALTEEVFDEIQYAIYWQLHHVYHNINFSRIAVRNNHAITETLTLYLGGLLFPTLPGAATWKEHGKRWFEEEIAYQIYEDGSFLQFSMNYHRVVIQLLTWGIQLATLNGETFDPIVAAKAERSLRFLRVCMNDHTGWLPNYGANDGALFFKLNDQEYRDFRPQLQALALLLQTDPALPRKYEDADWYGIQDQGYINSILEKDRELYSFPDGGYFVCREQDILTFLRCGNHKDRPSQADNLHLDIWVKDENLLMDAGSYKYNTDEATLRYFMGTASHNTVMLDDYDQMQKGPRFIWYNWSQCSRARLYETTDEYIWEGAITAFQQVGADIVHIRQVRKKKNETSWVIKDHIQHKPQHTLMRQLWHTSKPARIQLKAEDSSGAILQPLCKPGMYASYYGIKEENNTTVFNSDVDTIITEITID
ncbi:heparinase [Chitinophaga silvatica]|uniref:Heparinase n=1 Tax=Chitinophaga silvatica TaxID=2282649 RepID=A0A3E1Y9E2_9BACT|nr:alginate lyase family protein [Chitinophaga silvatica]RFS22024.1 heparinase [Chitinophaga silvatica]